MKALMTEVVRDELARLPVTTYTSEGDRRAELISALRMGRALSVSAGHVVVELILSSEPAAQRMTGSIAWLYRIPAQILLRGGSVDQQMFAVRVVRSAESLARRTGLLTLNGRPAEGLPPALTSGTRDESVAALRGAFLVCGFIDPPEHRRGRTGAVFFGCPTPTSAVALSGCLRRIGIRSKLEDGAVIRVGGTDAVPLLEAMGAHRSAASWARAGAVVAQRNAKSMRALVAANQRRGAQASKISVARARKAIEVLGDEVPPSLAEAGLARIDNPQLSLSQLGELLDPPVNKDSVAGKLRRLYALADKKRGRTA